MTQSENPPRFRTPVEVFQAQHVIEATLIVQRLADAGIPARIVSTALEGVTGEVPYSHATCPIWVEESDAGHAREVIQEYFDQPSIERTSDSEFCYHCGDVVTNEPANCPHCGASLDWS